MLDMEELIAETKKLVLLYVEDNPEAREATLLILNDLFDTIIVAEDGLQGLDKFKANKVDLIITDISMPNLDGLEMSKLIKQIDRTIPIIMLTAITDISVVKKAIDLRVDCFINKPLSDLQYLFEKFEQIITNINYAKSKAELEKIKQEQEKMKLIMNMITNISHHWKQPLSVISVISSSINFKLAHNIELTEDDFKNINQIPSQVRELASVLERIENIDFENITLNDVANIISISNPISKG